MTDDAAVASKAYREVKGCRLYCFPFEYFGSAVITLRARKMEHSYALVTSSDKAEYSKCLTYDSSFCVVSANKAVFERGERVGFGEDQSEKEDEVNEAFAKRDFCTVVVITSPSNNKSYMFPFIKDRVQDKKVIKDMRLIRTQGSYKELDYEDLENDCTPHHQFYITSKEFGENMDSYAEISDG